jgi:hypothetical protein
VKRTFISAAAILAFAASAHADELTDIQVQAKQLREQNQALMKRLSDIEKRQKTLETQAAAKPAVATVNPVDAMAADLPYKAAVKAKAPESDDVAGTASASTAISTWASPTTSTATRSARLSDR